MLKIVMMQTMVCFFHNVHVVLKKKTVPKQYRILQNSLGFASRHYICPSILFQGWIHIDWQIVIYYGNLILLI